VKGLFDIIFFSSKCNSERLVGGLRPDPLEELIATPKPLSWIQGVRPGKEGRVGGKGEVGQGRGCGGWDWVVGGGTSRGGAVLENLSKSSVYLSRYDKPPLAVRCCR